MNTIRFIAAVLMLAVLLWLALAGPEVEAQGPRGLYEMNAFNGQVAEGAVGATLFFAWSELNPAAGVYTWGSLEAQLDMHAAKGRQVALLVTVSRSGYYGDAIYVDDTPGWVGVTRKVAVGTKTLRLPAYDSAVWRAGMQAFVAELGRRYDGDGRLAHVMIGLGLDGESHAHKSAYETYVVAALGTGYKQAFESYARQCLTWYDKAFTRTALYCAANPGGQAFRKSLISYMLALGIGYKNAGLQIDDPTAWGPATYQTAGGNYALYAPMRDLAGALPLWLESTTGLASAESVYWALLLGMSWRPAGIDLHEEWFARNPAAIAWANGYLAEPTRGVWIVLRDREYGSYSPAIPETSSLYLSGWPGDLEYGMTRTSEAVRVLRASLPIECRDQAESRQARTFAESLTLRVAEPGALGPRVTVRLCYLDTAQALTVDVAGFKRQVGGYGTRRFVWAEWQQDVAGWDGTVSIEGEGTLHMVEMVKAQPVATSTPTCTMTETPTFTPTVTATVTPTPTVTPCPARLELSYAERMGIRDTAGEWLYTAEAPLDWQNDATLAHAGELGAPLSAAFAWGPYCCRAFALGIAVLDTCGNVACVGWDGEGR